MTPASVNVRTNKYRIAWEQRGIERALIEIMVAGDRGRTKHFVERFHQSQEPSRLVMGKNGKPYFDHAESIVRLYQDGRPLSRLNESKSRGQTNY